MKVESKLYGCQSMTGELQRVLVRAPRAEDLPGWRMCGGAPSRRNRIAAEHEAFCAQLAGAGPRSSSPSRARRQPARLLRPRTRRRCRALLLSAGVPARQVPALAGRRTGRCRSGAELKPSAPRAATAAARQHLLAGCGSGRTGRIARLELLQASRCCVRPSLARPREVHRAPRTSARRCGLNARQPPGLAPPADPTRAAARAA